MENQSTFHVLVVIDLQKEFKDQNGMYEKCIDFIRQNIDNYYILGTVWKNFDNSKFERHLHYSECKDVEYLPVGPGISPSIEYPFHELILKDGYGINSRGGFNYALDKIYKVASKQQNRCCPNIKFYLMGCDADACVLASAFTLWDRTSEFNIFTDLIYTTGGEDLLKHTIKIMERNFGDCVTTSVKNLPVKEE